MLSHDTTTERGQLLAAVRAGGFDDMAALAYADWLCEYGEGDRDAATVEFIRLACDMRPGGRTLGPMMGPRAYPWLDANWHRLVPAAVALHDGCWRDGAYHRGGVPPFERVGRSVRCMWTFGVGVQGWLGCLSTRTVTLRFLRGFVEVAEVHARDARRVVAPALAADQPLARFPYGFPEGG